MKRFLKSFVFAGRGICYCIRHEKNFQIQLIAAIVVIILGFYFSISLHEWVLLLVCIALVLGLEMINSSIEKMADLISLEYHPLIKIIKDTAAGAVLLVSIISAIIGFLIFLPKI